MNQKGFASLVLVGAMVVLLAIGGYFVWTHKSPKLQLEVHTDPIPAPNIKTSKTYTNTQANEVLTYPVGISLSSICKFVGSKGSADASGTAGDGYVLGDNEWLIDCGTNNNNARGTMGIILEQQGWKFCSAQTGTGSWWKDGVITWVAESAGVTYPFRITQEKGTSCQ